MVKITATFFFRVQEDIVLKTSAALHCQHCEIGRNLAKTSLSPNGTPSCLAEQI